MGESLKEKILDELKPKEVLDLACRLVKIPSENPPGDVSEISVFIEDYLSEAGITVERHEPEKGRINLVARIGERSGKELIFNGHMDVVPAGDKSRWRFDPYLGEIRDGYILGRGASDMKGGLAGIIYAFRKLARYEGELGGRLTLACVSDEETGGEYGTKYLVSQGIAVGSSALIAEPTGLDLINVGEKGALWMKITVYGKPAHGSLAPYAGENAILKAADLMKELLKIIELKPTLPQELKAVVEESKRIGEQVIGIKNVSRILDHLSMNFGVIRGGTKINVVPERCELEVDVRVPIGMKSDEVASYIEELASRYGGEVSYIGRGDANHTPPSAEIVRVVSLNVSQVIGVKPRLFIQWASSDARYYRWRGVPTIHYGPAEIGVIHGYDEVVKAEDVVKACMVYAATALDYLKQ